MKKAKFKPGIIRIKLNPEQAVLTCECYDGGFRVSNENFVSSTWSTNLCTGRSFVRHCLHPDGTACAAQFDCRVSWKSALGGSAS